MGHAGLGSIDWWVMWVTGHIWSTPPLSRLQDVVTYNHSVLRQRNDKNWIRRWLAIWRRSAPIAFILFNRRVVLSTQRVAGLDLAIETSSNATKTHPTSSRHSNNHIAYIRINSTDMDADTVSLRKYQNAFFFLLSYWVGLEKWRAAAMCWTFIIASTLASSYARTCSRWRLEQGYSDWVSHLHCTRIQKPSGDMWSWLNCRHYVIERLHHKQS